MSSTNTEKRSLGNQIQDASKIFGPISGAFGFVSDVIRPISPFIHVVTVICAIISAILFVFYLMRKRREIYEKLSHYFSQFFVFTVVLSFFWFIGSDSEQGFFAENFEVVASVQESLAVGPVGGDKDLSSVKDQNSSQPDTYYLDITTNRLRPGGGSAEDQIVNAIVFFNNGHYERAALLFDSVVAKGLLKYDLLHRFYESLFYVYKGDLAAVDDKLQSAGLSDNQLMALAKIDFLYKGVDYYKELSRLTFDDPLLRSFGENLKAKSLLADLNHYYLYESYALEYWIPVMRRNQEALGKNLINIRDLFFDFQGSYRNYLNVTTHHGDEHFVWEWPIDDPGKRAMAEVMWKRIQSGDLSRVLLNYGQTVTGKVVDADGNPIPGILVSDFDAFPKISSKEVFTGTTTDESGTFTLITGTGHLLRFSSLDGEQNYKEVFKTVQSDKPLTVELEVIK